MKALKTIGHPIILICIFPMLLIEGDNFGGLYFLYLLMALPHGAPYAIFALLGIVLILIGSYVKMLSVRLRSKLNLTGVSLMMVSLIIFFYPGNKNQTFELVIPLISFAVFGLIATCFIINNTYSIFHTENQEPDLEFL